MNIICNDQRQNAQLTPMTNILVFLLVGVQIVRVHLGVGLAVNCSD